MNVPKASEKECVILTISGRVQGLVIVAARSRKPSR